MSKTNFFSERLHWVVTLLISLFITWVLVIPMAGSGVYDKMGNLLFDPGPTFYDAGVHLSLINEMQYRFPPTNFALGGVPLKNYHYLYDAVLALVSKISNISTLDLYFRVGPVIISLLLCLAIYLTIKQLTGNRWAATFGIFFTIMATSLGPISPFLKVVLPGNVNSAGSGLFMTDQIYDWMVNPQGVLALVIFLFIYLCISFYQSTKKIRYLITLSLLLGISFGVKAYGGVVFAAGASITGLWYLLQKNYRPAVAIFAGLGLMGLWFITMTDNSRVGLHYAPMWFLDRMMADYEHLYQADFPVIINMYLFVGNWWHPLALYLKAFLIYLVGSLGLRIFGLTVVFMGIKKNLILKKIPPANIFLFITSFVSFAIPFIFNQSSKPYDIVQFIPYFTLAMGIAFTVFLFHLISKFPSWGKFFTIFMTVIIFLSMDITKLNERIHPPADGSKTTLSKDLLAATDYLRTHTPVDSIVLLAPTNMNLGYLWFTSVAARRTTLSGVFFSQQVGENYLLTEKQVQNAFSGLSSNLNFDYLFLEKRDKPYLNQIQKHYSLQSIFDNNAAVIYKKI